jgi:CheY-like chemotaxis protein
LLTRALADWSAQTSIAADEQTAGLLLSQRGWDAILVDRALGGPACARLARASGTITSRIVLLTPAERNEINPFKAAGFTGYLIKPIRATSLAALMIQGRSQETTDDCCGLAPRADPRPCASAGAGDSRAVLIAEDNDINALLAETILARLGHRPTIVPTGEAAVAAYVAAQAEGVPYDLLLMDIHMPRGDGLEATKRIRAIEAAGGVRRLPIFALTATALDEDRSASLAAGMDGFLAKPIDRQQLSDLLAGLSAAAAARAA